MTKKKKSAEGVAAATKAPPKPVTTRKAPETQLTAARTAAATEAWAKKKKKMRTAPTTESRKITFAQFQRYEELLRKEQEEEWVSHAFVGSPVYENCVEGVILHQSEVKPSYARILKRGTKGAPQARGYAAAAAALSGIPAIMKKPTRKKRAPPEKRTMMDPNKLYLDSAATYHSMFVKRYLKNVRDAGRILRGN